MPGRSKNGRARRQNRCSRFWQNTCGDSTCQIQNRTHVREPVKPTAPADTVTGVRRSRRRVVDKRVRRRKSHSEWSVAKIAVRRVNCQAGQYRAQQPCDTAGRRCNCAIHAFNDNPRPG